MLTIRIDEKTRAGRVLIETVKMMANKYSGIYIDDEDDEILKQRMQENNQSDFLTKDEKENFLDELHKLSD